MMGFFSLVEQKLGNRGRSTEWDAERVAAKICETVDGVWPIVPQPPPPATIITNLADASDSEVIHEALKRGFAVMRLPEPKDPA